jgi:hypothetical protein
MDLSTGKTFTKLENGSSVILLCLLEQCYLPSFGKVNGIAEDLGSFRDNFNRTSRTRGFLFHYSLLIALHSPNC